MRNKVGIYKITNTANGKIYIGQSNNIGKRIAEHKNRLLRNIHTNPHLQSSYNKYGKKSFEYETVEICDIELLYQRENYWMNFYQSFDRNNGYNIDLPSEDGTSYTTSDETKIKMSETKIIYSEEELLSYLQEFYYMEGRVPTQRDLISERYGKYPNYISYFKRFGSFKGGLTKAGLYDFVENKRLYQRKEYSKEDVIENYSSFIKEYGRFPNTEDRLNTVNNGLCSIRVILKHFQNIQELKDYFGFTKEKELQKENEESLLALKKLYDEQGFIERKSIDKSPITRSAKFYSNRFGSLYVAYELAGIDPKKDLGRSKGQVNRRAM